MKQFHTTQAALIADLIAAALLCLFLYTGLSKLADYQGFATVLQSVPIISPLAHIAAFALPAIEVAVAFLLFIPFTRIAGLYLSFFLLLLFTCYLTYMVLFVPDLPCNCGGVLQALSWEQHILFNLVFVVLAITGIHFYNRSKNRRSSPPP